MKGSHFTQIEQRLIAEARMMNKNELNLAKKIITLKEAGLNIERGLLNNYKNVEKLISVNTDKRDLYIYVLKNISVPVNIYENSLVGDILYIVDIGESKEKIDKILQLLKRIAPISYFLTRPEFKDLRRLLIVIQRIKSLDVEIQGDIKTLLKKHYNYERVLNIKSKNDLKSALKYYKHK